METQAPIFATIGAILLAGLAIDAAAKRLRLPRVTLMLVFGFLVGPAVFDLLPVSGELWFSTFTNAALVMVGFLLGEKVTKRMLEHGMSTILWVSAAVILGTGLIVSAGLVLLGYSPELSLLLGAIAVATDPAATVDVIDETRAQGRFSELLEGVVALDDAWGLIIFTVALAAAESFAGGTGVATAIGEGARELFGAVLVGVAVGAPAAYLTGRIKPGEPTLVEALGIVFLCGGIAIWLEVSYILASIVLGVMVANFAQHHSRPFHAIEHIEWPFMVLFFVFAGAALEVQSLAEVGVVGAAFVGLRIIGRLAGSLIGAKLAGVPKKVKGWMGVALLPQAGVALGLALIASDHFPHLRSVIMPVVIGTTVLFEVIGPLGTRFALTKVDEAGKAEPDQSTDASESTD